MIFLLNNKSKMMLLYILAFVFTGAIVYQWAKFNPFAEVASVENDQFFAQIGFTAEDTIEDIQNNVDLGKIEISNLKNELERQAKQEALLEEVKNYFNTTSSEE